jgi:hypothetical protein
MIKFRFIAVGLLSILLAGCGSLSVGRLDDIRLQAAHINAGDIESKDKLSIFQNRANSSRTFYAADHKYIPGAIIATLQDMGYFVVDSGSPGYISASRSVYTEDRVMVVYKSEGDEFVTIRVNFSRSIMDGDINIQRQKFFSSITKSLFLIDNGL